MNVYSVPACDTASVLIFVQEFFEIIVNEPSGKYRDPKHHPFNRKINYVMLDTEVSIVTFRKRKTIDISNEKSGWV